MQLCSSLNNLWHCLSLGLEGKLTFSSPVGTEFRKLMFSSPVVTEEFSRFADILSTVLSQHHLLGFEIAQLEFNHLH